MTSTSTHTTTGRIVGLAAVTMAILISAVAAWAHSADTALAPEAAKLIGTVALSTNGQLGPAMYLSGSPTGIVRWPSSGQANRDGAPFAGQPCTTIYLAPYSQTSKVIRVSGTSRLCY